MRKETDICYVGCTHKCKSNQGVIVGRSQFLGWSPSNYNLFYHIEQEFGSQISLNIVKEVIEVDELDEGNTSAATGKY